MNHRILLIEDDKDIQLIVQKTVEELGELVIAPTLKQAKQLLQDVRFDLLLLDVVLPDGDGFAFCASLQESQVYRDIPLIFLTAKTAVTDRITGFSSGADDYVVKPFHPLELEARIRARLKRKEDTRNLDLWVNESLRFDMGLQRAMLATKSGTADLDLTPIEFKMLYYFCRNPEAVVTREQIQGALWSSNIQVVERTIDVHICKLRKKIAGSDFRIQSVYGIGYRFTKEQEEEPCAQAS